MKPTVTTLPNGSRIIQDPNPGMNTVGIVAGIHIGSRFEDKPKNGISHLLEHLLFKGSAKYKDSKAVSKALDDKGGFHNAYTSQEMTTVQARIASEYETVAADLVMDVISTSRLRPGDIAKEKPVVCDEIRMYDADDRDRLNETSTKLIYGTDPVAWPICGTVKTVMAMTPTEIRKFYDAHYVPGRIAVSLSGKYTDKTVQLVEKALLDLNGPTSDEARPVRPRTRLPVYGAASAVKPSITPRVFLRITFVGPSPTNRRDSAAFEVLALTLGGYSSARLFDTLRVKHSLCYYVGANYEVTSDASSLIVSMELEPKNIQKSIELLGQELRRMARSGPKPEEIASAKSAIRGHIALLRDSVLGTAERNVSSLLLDGRVEPADEALARYEAVSTEDIRTVIQNHLLFPQTVILAPVKYEASTTRLVAKHIETL